MKPPAFGPGSALLGFRVRLPRYRDPGEVGLDEGPHIVRARVGEGGRDDALHRLDLLRIEEVEAERADVGLVPAAPNL